MKTKIKLLLLSILLLCQSNRLAAQHSLWVGETYQCFLEDYADKSLSWVNIDWSVDYGLYTNYSGNYVRTVSFSEYKSGTYDVTVKWTQTDMSDPFAPFYHKSHTWSFTCKDNPLILTQSSLNLSVGDTKQLECRFTYNNSYTQGISYSSNNTSVASVSYSGLVTAKAEGTATITAQSASSRDVVTCKITVAKSEKKVTSISLNKTSASLSPTAPDNTVQLTATVYPSDATDKTVTWSSDNNSVATVSNSGLVTAKAEGTATITCKANDGSGVTATCLVTVTAPVIEPTGITISPSSKTINVGETFYASYTLTPSNATTTVTWSSDDTSIATVSQTGLVKGIAAGSTWINVMTANGKMDWFKITVNAVPKPKLTLVASPSGGTVESGTKVYLTAQSEGSTVSGADIYYTTNGTTPSKSSMKYTSSGITISSSTTIKAIAYKDGYDASDIGSWSYTVNNEKSDVYLVSVTCDNNNLGRLTNSDKLIFHATFGNDGATDTIPTAIMLINDEMTRILARGDYEWAIVKKGEQVTMDYEYALDTIPQGQYKATVLYFDWNEEYWIYDSRFVYTITIVNNSAKGDVNMDNAVNGTDLVALSNIVLGRKEKTESADVNGDGSVNGTDIVALSNIILGRNNIPRRIKRNAENIPQGFTHRELTLKLREKQHPIMSQNVAARRAGEAGAGLSIEPFDIHVGEEKEMLIDLTNPNDEITMVQFDLHLPEGLSVKKSGADLDIDMGDRTSWRKHTLDASEVDGGYRFLLYSSSNTVIDGTSGAVIKVKVVANASFNGGKIVIDNTLLTSPDEKETKPEAYEYVFPTVDDGSAKLAIEPFDIKAGEETEMLIDLSNPNDEITMVQFDMYLPEGLTVKKSGADLVYDMADRTSWRKHTLDANEVDGGYRFLLYSSSNTAIDGTNGAVIKVTLAATQDMKGKTIALDNILLVSPDEKETKPARYEYVIGTDGIRAITIDNDASAPIYNLRGQRLTAPQKGINIIAGKKVVVK